MNLKVTTLYLVLICSLALYLFFPVLNTYFSQDDFFHFKISQTDNSIGGFIKLFGFYKFDERGVAFYRPIFREGLYNLYYQTFGIKHLPFRTLQFVLYFIDIILVFALTKKIFKSNSLVFFVTLFFSISSSNIAVLYYLAGGIQILGATMFFLLSLLFYLSFLETKKITQKFLSFLFFILSLASHEISITLPVCLLGLTFLKNPFSKALKFNLKETYIFYLAAFLFIYIDFFYIGFSHSEQQYQTVFSLKKILNTISWYFLWALGLPEMLTDFVQSGFRLNPDLLKYWGNFFKVIFPVFFTVFSLLLFFLSIIFKNSFRKSTKTIFIFLGLFIIMLGPVSLLPLHKSSYYLIIALPFFWTFIGIVIFDFYHNFKNKNLSKLLISLVILSLVTLSLTSLKLGESTYWAARRGKIAGKILADFKNKYPTIPKGSIMYIKNDPNYPFISKEWGGTSKQAATALNNQDGLQLFYHDNSLKIFYEDLGNIPDEYKKIKIYELTAYLN